MQVSMLILFHKKKTSHSCKGFMTDALLSWSFKPPRFSKPWRFCGAVVSLVKPCRFLMIMLFDKKSPHTPARAFFVFSGRA
ncbi:MAG: hypothetical protein GDA51_02040 [Ekhidna sp.]|nr:hypothetical protein [Ekhidna sp.]